MTSNHQTEPQRVRKMNCVDVLVSHAQPNELLLALVVRNKAFVCFVLFLLVYFVVIICYDLQHGNIVRDEIA